MSESTFEIAMLQTLISIQSLDAVHQIEVTHGSTKRVVETDHIAHVRREITFADAVQPNELFEIRYATRSGGYVKPRWEGGDNLAGSADLGRYDDYGTECIYAFKPLRDQLGPYVLDVEVLNGFGPGHRDVHFHLGGKRCYQNIEYVLDLTAFTNVPDVSPQPVLFLHPDDPEHGSLPNLRATTPPAPATEPKPMLWQWCFENVATGLVDIYWDSESAS